MRKPLTSLVALLFAPALFGCAETTSFVKSDTTLGRVVIYRNGVAYFERSATIHGDSLKLNVPPDKIDDFLKSLTVIDESTGKPAPISFPSPGTTSGDTVDMHIGLAGAAPHRVRLSYVTEAPSWKPSYRVVLGKDGKVDLESWAVVDNTSGEDWEQVQLGVGSSSALSFRFDLHSIRLVDRATLRSDDLFAQAPPTGEILDNAGYAQQGQRIVMELSDDALRSAEDESKRDEPGKKRAEIVSQQLQIDSYGGGRGAGASKPATKAGGGGATAMGAANGYPQQAPPREVAQLQSTAQALQRSSNQIVIEGYADAKDKDANAASLERANRAREQLIRQGVDASRVVAVGKGSLAGKSAGVRIVEEQLPPPPPKSEPSKPGDTAPMATEPIGTSHFESTSAMTVARGTSAMVSILRASTEGEVVYLYDAESIRGNGEFPFRSVRLLNPTGSVLESGPVTVFGEGRFIGEGLSEPIPARSMAFVPFALDRQIHVERKESSSDRIARIITVQRGVFSTESQQIKKTVLVVKNRLDEPAKVYVRHTVPQGFALLPSSQTSQRLGAAHLFRVDVPPKGEKELVIEEATPVFRTVDVRTNAGMDLVVAYLSSAATTGPLKESVTKLLALQRDMANTEQRIQTLREQADEYRQRMDELHGQIVTLRLVKSAGPLVKSLEKKLAEVNERISKLTLEIVTHEEKLMIARINFQDGVAELSLEKKDAP